MFIEYYKLNKLLLHKYYVILYQRLPINIVVFFFYQGSGFGCRDTSRVSVYILSLTKLYFKLYIIVARIIVPNEQRLNIYMNHII